MPRVSIGDVPVTFASPDTVLRRTCILVLVYWPWDTWLPLTSSGMVGDDASAVAICAIRWLAVRTSFFPLPRGEKPWAPSFVPFSRP